ncbi:MAG: TRAP transporter small permease [Ramlibacter sp.]|nr:TRAP transporter small permease [Ramlibacter sp.]
MNSLLQRLVGLTALLGAISFVAVEAMVLYQLGGQFLPYIPRAADEFAGYFMGASAFLALAYTFAADEHIRVTLVLDRVGAETRRMLERLAVTLAAALAAYLAWHISKLAWQSWHLDERSSGLIALPMWIPQAAMALGAVTFFLTVAERARRVWHGAAAGIEPKSGEVLRADR